VTETFFAFVSSWGVFAVFASAFFSCLALPIPTAFVMLAAGAFAASGDLALWQVFAAAYAGAIAGDQTGFLLGRAGGPRIATVLGRRPERAELLTRARALVDRRGGIGVFFSTWLFAPLGPWVNFTSGAAGLGWVRFTLWDAAGEAIWVTFYLGMGYVFADRIRELATLLSNSSGLLVAALATAILGYALIRAAKAR
jgi:membrane protein DedA with SNARE-associated domain